jgi:hypothetical protein
MSLRLRSIVYKIVPESCNISTSRHNSNKVLCVAPSDSHKLQVKPNVIELRSPIGRLLLHALSSTEWPPLPQSLLQPSSFFYITPGHSLATFSNVLNDFLLFGWPTIWLERSSCTSYIPTPAPHYPDCLLQLYEHRTLLLGIIQTSFASSGSWNLLVSLCLHLSSSPILNQPTDHLFLMLGLPNFAHIL